MSLVLLGLPLAAVAVLIMSLSAGVVMAASRSLLILPSRWGSTWCVAGLALFPAICGGLSWLALGIATPFTHCHCYAHGLHHPHLCAAHPELAEPLFWPALSLVLLWTLLVARRPWPIIRSLQQTARLARVVRKVPPELVDGTPVRLLDLGVRRAFSVGVLWPLIVVDRGLWASLSPEERRAVVHHELWHAERRDGLTLVALRVFTALCPWPFGADLIRSWRGLAERACDLRAAQVIGDRNIVAETLLVVERASASARDGRLPGLALGMDGEGELEERVLALLEGRQRTPDLGNDLLSLAAITGGAALLILVLPGSTFHHAVETVLGLVVHP